MAKHMHTTRMWTNAQRDGRPTEYRWRPLFNAAKFGWRPILECPAVTLPIRENRWNLQGCPNYRTDLSRYWAEVHHIVGTSRGDIAINKFFPIVDSCLICEDIARQSCTMVCRWRVFASCISASRVQHVSDLHPKFAVRPLPHHVWKYGRHPISDRWD